MSSRNSSSFFDIWSNEFGKALKQIPNIVRYVSLAGMTFFLVVGLCIVFSGKKKVLLLESVAQEPSLEFASHFLDQISLGILCFILSLIFSAILIYSFITPAIKGLAAAIYSNKNQHNEETIVLNDESLSLEINVEGLKSCFMPFFLATNNETGDSQFSFFIESLSSKKWTKTELGRIALLLKESKVLQPENSKDFTKWMKLFFKLLGRSDCPGQPDKGTYKHFPREDKVRNTFPKLIQRYQDIKGTYLEIQ